MWWYTFVFACILFVCVHLHTYVFSDVSHITHSLALLQHEASGWRVYVGGWWRVYVGGGGGCTYVGGGGGCM